MTEEGSFPRLVELIREGIDDEMGLHKTLVELMYEMSRIQEIAAEELGEHQLLLWSHHTTLTNS